MSDCGCSTRKPTAKGLASMGQPRAGEALVELAGAVARCEHQPVAGEGAAVGEDQAADPPLHDLDVGGARVPDELAAASLQLLAAWPTRRREARPSRRAACPARGSARRCRSGRRARPPCAPRDGGCGWRASRRCRRRRRPRRSSCSTRSRARRSRISRATSRRRGAHGLAAVDHDRPDAALQQPPGAEEPGRSGAEDHRREVGRADRRKRRLGLGNGVHSRWERGQSPLDLDLRVHHPAWMSLAPRVERPAGHRDVLQALRPRRRAARRRAARGCPGARRARDGCRGRGSARGPNLATGARSALRSRLRASPSPGGV